jgi:glycosyltransferase involved in cell wall biosynthesis
VRLLIDYRPALRERTGVGEFVHELARALTAASGNHAHHVTLFTSSWKDRPDAALAGEMPGATIADVKVPVRALVWSWNRLEWPPVEWLAGDHDVVHSQSPLLIPATRAAQAVTVHDLDFLRYPEQMPAEIRRDYPALARAHAARADAVIVSSQYAAGEVTRELQLARDRVHVCPPGPPSWAAEVRQRRPDFAPTSPRLPRASSGFASHSSAGHILFMGTLSLRKNVGTLLEAYARLRAQVPEAPRLVLAGHATPASARWEARCKQPPLAGHVEITGYVTTEQRIALYEGARMLVLPSYEEGFGLPVLEAMACGVPVVVSSRGSLPEVAGPAATPVDPDDVDGLVSRMRELLDRRVAAPASERGLAQASRYSWTACAAAALSAYAAAVEVHAHRG